MCVGKKIKLHCVGCLFKAVSVVVHVFQKMFVQSDTVSSLQGANRVAYNEEGIKEVLKKGDQKHDCLYNHHCLFDAPLFVLRSMPPFLKFLLILCQLLPCCPSEAQLFEVRTHFVRSDLHSRRCLFVFALCVGVFKFFFCGVEKFLKMIFLFGWRKKYSLKKIAFSVGLCVF